MSKRLQVLLAADEWEELQAIARRHRMTVSEWVRRTLREARQREPSGGLESKRAAIRAAARHEFPTADIEQVLEEVLPITRTDAEQAKGRATTSPN